MILPLKALLMAINALIFLLLGLGWALSVIPMHAARALVPLQKNLARKLEGVRE